ncbi:MAG TPA: TIGR04283 family arsenosugar biosynthesis glycosyltransferase [Blastocatellia bacterium]|nr:TIGR04283 family arsenosugar biosynthesis glycosyltransferase [Blastocatellia bacterium]
MSVSIVIPTLNEARLIPATANALQRLRGSFEVVIVDGNSTDETVTLAEANHLRVISAPRGRGSQMNAGAVATQGETLLFLHADTHLPENALELIESALRAPDVCGGNFSLCFAGDTYGARLLTYLYPHLRWLGLVYGDSAIFVRRRIFESLGGYREIPLFEDCDLYRRLCRQGRFVRLADIAVTSGRRFEGRFLRTFSFWVIMQVLYWVGVAPHRLAQMYRLVR